jgi:UDP-4-amino-4,6-dideoxy-N-acetyl-beta-L-altrosamine N-acetyltransferase
MLKGKNIYLASVSKESIEQLRNWRNNPEFRKYFREYREISKEMQNAWFMNRVEGNSSQIDFEIRDIKTDTLIGHCGLYYINWVNRTAEFTIYVGDLSFRGAGFGSSALRTLLKYGFEDLNLNKIWCEVYDNNEAIEIYKHLGFVPEGILRKHVYKNGAYLDAHVLSLLREEFGETFCE